MNAADGVWTISTAKVSISVRALCLFLILTAPPDKAQAAQDICHQFEPRSRGVSIRCRVLLPRSMGSRGRG